MNLTQLLKQIAKSEGIPESELIWDEVKWFEENHVKKGHGPYELLIRTTKEGGIESIEATCMATNVSQEECAHYSTGYSELSFSSFYHSKLGEEKSQKERREGRFVHED